MPATNPYTYLEKLFDANFCSSTANNCSSILPNASSFTNASPSFDGEGLGDVKEDAIQPNSKSTKSTKPVSITNPVSATNPDGEETSSDVDAVDSEYTEQLLSELSEVTDADTLKHYTSQFSLVGNEMLSYVAELSEKVDKAIKSNESVAYGSSMSSTSFTPEKVEEGVVKVEKDAQKVEKKVEEDAKTHAGVKSPVPKQLHQNDSTLKKKVFPKLSFFLPKNAPLPQSISEERVQAAALKKQLKKAKEKKKLLEKEVVQKIKEEKALREKERWERRENRHGSRKCLPGMGRN
ncbi:hypothetical protein TrVE_jg1470 [Triparma verrucosa]|uniref:Uncharacterized protein n=1 Tax=Triparma verrucosa TaxID=1606542 RepID=A0A9W7BEA5_9STRA|nr:hypothetical protein TrVE_jg1470 [Triparma verrucosa]